MAAKCKCGCGQANTGRLRKVECVMCGNIAYQSRTAIHRGQLVCPCGEAMEPPCVQDRVALPNEVGEAAYREIAARESVSAQARWANECGQRKRAARKAWAEMSAAERAEWGVAPARSVAGFDVGGSTWSRTAAEMPF